MTIGDATPDDRFRLHCLIAAAGAQIGSARARVSEAMATRGIPPAERERLKGMGAALKEDGVLLRIWDAQLFLSGDPWIIAPGTCPQPNWPSVAEMTRDLGARRGQLPQGVSAPGSLVPGMSAIGPLSLVAVLLVTSGVLAMSYVAVTGKMEDIFLAVRGIGGSSRAVERLAVAASHCVEQVRQTLPKDARAPAVARCMALINQDVIREAVRATEREGRGLGFGTALLLGVSVIALTVIQLRK